MDRYGVLIEKLNLIKLILDNPSEELIEKARRMKTEIAPISKIIKPNE